MDWNIVIAVGTILGVILAVGIPLFAWNLAQQRELAVLKFQVQEMWAYQMRRARAAASERGLLSHTPDKDQEANP
jgi:hypothetical protein